MGEISITFKEGASHDAPWIVIKAESVDLASAILEELRSKGVFQGVKAAAREFQAATPANAAAAVRNVQAAIPGSQEQKLPDAVTPGCGYCHDPAQWKEGVSGKGTPYSGWYCQTKDCDNYWKPVK